MPIRNITKRPSAPRLGDISNSKSGRKWTGISKVTVYESTGTVGTRTVCFSVERANEKKDGILLNLSPNCAIELVKGILLNLPYISVGGDEELLGILKAATTDCEEDSTAMLKLLDEQTKNWSAEEILKREG